MSERVLWSIKPSDLVDRDQCELPVEPDGTLQVDLPAYGLATVCIGVGPEPCTADRKGK
jgi:hypothetical protein